MTCHTCHRPLVIGESAWGTDITVIEPTGPRLVTRYMCNDCDAKADAG